MPPPPGFLAMLGKPMRTGGYAPAGGYAGFGGSGGSGGGSSLKTFAYPNMRETQRDGHTTNTDWTVDLNKPFEPFIDGPVMDYPRQSSAGPKTNTGADAMIGQIQSNMPQQPNAENYISGSKPYTMAVPSYGVFAGNRGGASAQYRTNPMTGEREIDPEWTGRYGTHVPGTAIDAGSRRIGSVNYGAVGGIQNFLGQTGQAGANYLRSLGAMPTVNGRPLDDDYGVGGTADALGGIEKAGRDLPPLTPEQYRARAQNRARGLSSTGQPYAEGWGPDGYIGGAGGAAAGGSGGVGGAGGIGGAGCGGGGSVGGAGGLEQSLSDAYQAIIGQGGHALDPTQENAQSQRAVDANNRATRDAIEASRLSAARRGVDPLGNPDLESRISQRGAADAIKTRQDIGISQQQNAIQNLLQALGSSGAGGYIGNRAQNEILLGQLAQQGSLGNLSMILGGK